MNSLKYDTSRLMAALGLALLVLSAWTLALPASAQAPCQCNVVIGTNPKDTLALRQSTNPACKALYAEILAELNLRAKQFDSALHHLQVAEGIYQQNNCPPSARLTAWKLYTGLYDHQAKYEEALAYALKALTLYEQNGNAQEQAATLLNIAQIFNRMKQSEKGIAYTRRAVAVVNNLPMSAIQVELLNKITARYFYHAQDAKNMLFADTAETFVNRALTGAKTINNVKEQIIAYTRLAAIDERRGKLPSAIANIKQGLQLCQPGVNTRQYCTLYGDLGNILMKQGQYAEARSYADSCLYYSQKEQYPPLIVNAHALIYTIEEKAGHYKEAIQALKKAQDLSDSLTTADRTKAINELEKKYDQAKNEKTIRELSQQKQIYTLLAATALLIAISIGFFLRQQTLKHRQTVLETEQRLNRARMNPHFFFNALASLQTMAIQNNDGKAMAINLSKFSHIMRETLESTYKDYVSITQEVDFLQEYLELQRMRFPQKFDFSITTASELPADDYKIPSMIIQPFVENSVEHGFQHIAHLGHLQVHFSIEQGEIKVEITDNGIGLADKRALQKEHISRASQIIADRIYLLNIKLKTRARFNISNRNHTEGVAVVIYLPIIEDQTN